MTLFHQYTLTTDPDLYPVLIAFLGAAGFDSFQETPTALEAYAPAEDHDRWVTTLDDLRGRYDFTYAWAPLADKNWNEEWERQFSPIRVGERLLIRADFHPGDGAVEQELVITPKMAFGTGHHATTYMMCELLFEQDLAGKRVLDYGSGTGVLAILAKRLGAGPVDAVDIESWAAENTAENAARNGVELRHVIHGELPDVPREESYQIVLANINRNVILATAGALYDRLESGGKVLFSGILAQDEDMLRDRLVAAGFIPEITRRREDWRAFVFSRP